VLDEARVMPHGVQANVPSPFTNALLFRPSDDVAHQALSTVSRRGGFGVALLNGGKVIEGAGTNGDVHVQAHETNSGLRLITFMEGEAKGTP